MRVSQCTSVIQVTAVHFIKFPSRQEPESRLTADVHTKRKASQGSYTYIYVNGIRGDWHSACKLLISSLAHLSNCILVSGAGTKLIIAGQCLMVLEADQEVCSRFCLEEITDANRSAVVYQPGRWGVSSTPTTAEQSTLLFDYSVSLTFSLFLLVS